MKKVGKPVYICLSVAVFGGGGMGGFFFCNAKKPHFDTPAQISEKSKKNYPPDEHIFPIATSSAKTELSFADQKKIYGPCAVVPTLFYHHIQDLDQAKAAGHAQFTVGPQFFRKQMQYLKDRQYNVISMQSLIDFFDHGAKLAKKPILITVDDGYDDFANYAVPILREFHYPSTLFTPTGLIQNPGYLTWSKLNEFGHDGSVLVANHTWSHHNMQASTAVVEHEITTAEKQLKDHGFDAPKVFAYPYGLVG